MTVPTWRQAEKYAHEYRFKAQCSRIGSTARTDAEKEAEWWENYAREIKACTYDTDQDMSDGFITFDDGHREAVGDRELT